MEAGYYWSSVLVAALFVILAATPFAEAQTAPATLQQEEQIERDFTDPLSTLPQVIIRESYTPAKYGPCTPLACVRNYETNQFIIRPLIPRVPLTRCFRFRS